VVGKAVFAKYFYVFAYMTDKDCMEIIAEDYTEKTKKDKIAAAKAIFRHRQQYEALKIICNSPKINMKTRNRALRIFYVEKLKRKYFMST
ncbi:MAG: hypothetical protein K2J79_03555, partial [Ruminiclostridium sp.]|nr:hypothetical protein [Ruminiclostridium sp.]